MAAVLLALALVLLVPILVEQVRQLVTALPAETERFKAFIERYGREWLGPSFPSFQTAIDKALAEQSQNWGTMLAAIVASVWSRGLALVNFVSLLLITPIVVFYLLVDWHPMLARIDQALPRDHASTIRRLAAEINDAVAAFIRGQGAICLVLGVYYAIGLSWAGIEYGLLVGLSTGLLAFIPIIGWLLGFITAATLAIVQFWPDLVPLVKVAGVLISGMAIDTAFLSPRFVGQKVGLHPVWLIFALFVFSYLFGLVGTLVAVPLAAATAVLVRFAVQVYLDSSVYKGNDAAPASPEQAQGRRHDRRAGPAHPRSGAPPGAGGGGLPHQRLQPGRRRHRRPLAGLAAPVGGGGGAAGRRQDASGQRLAPEVGCGRICGQRLSEADVARATGALLVEDLHAGIGDQRVLFHLLNLVREHKLSMLLTSRLAPGELDVSLPDLRSRLRALPLVTIAPPDDGPAQGRAGQAFRRPAARAWSRT